MRRRICSQMLKATGASRAWSKTATTSTANNNSCIIARNLYTTRCHGNHVAICATAGTLTHNYARCIGHRIIDRAWSTPRSGPPLQTKNSTRSSFRRIPCQSQVQWWWLNTRDHTSTHDSGDYSVTTRPNIPAFVRVDHSAFQQHAHSVHPVR